MQIAEYIKDVHAELRHVKWPTRRTTLVFTLIVVALSVAMALYLGAFDWLFSEAITSVI